MPKHHAQDADALGHIEKTDPLHSRHPWSLPLTHSTRAGRSARPACASACCGSVLLEHRFDLLLIRGERLIDHIVHVVIRVCAQTPAEHDVRLFGGLLLLTFAIRVSPAGEYHPTWGDRNDGRRVRTLSPMAQITTYFQWERNICSNFFEESFEITNIDRYIRQKRKEGLKDFGITHVLLAAYVRGVAKYPQLNRFISGQKVYSRGEDIQYCMVVKKEMTVESPDTSIKVHLTPHDTAEDVYNKLNAAVEAVKATTELDSNLDGLIDVFNLIPGVFLKFLVWLLKFLDYFLTIPADDVPKTSLIREFIGGGIYDYD